MHLTNHIHPTEEQITRLIKEYPPDTPVVMVNILRYNEETVHENESGETAYERYSLNVLPFLKKVGGQLLWRGRVHSTVIGDDVKEPHMILLVQYPSVQNFITMASDPEYLKIASDRTIALEYGGLLASIPDYSRFEK